MRLLNFDINLSLSALGLVLTILFFVIGYWQTIGARKERARAANTQLIDVLFRRLAHEQEFTLSSGSVETLLEGWALQGRTRYSDILQPSEVEAFLVARVIENDYISDEQRTSIMHRIKSMFQNEPQASLIPGDSRIGFRWQRESLVLALASGIAALGSTLLAGVGLASRTPQVPKHELNSAFVAIIAVVTLTTIALGLFAYVRDWSRSGRIEGQLAEDQSGSLERSIYRTLHDKVPSLKPAKSRSLDFTYSSEGKQYGIEVKRDVNRLGKSQLKMLVDRLATTANELQLEKVYILSSTPPKDALADDPHSKITVLSVREFIGKMTTR